MGVLLRFIFMGIIAWIVFRLLQRSLGLGTPPPSREDEHKATAPPQAMRPCAQCKVHIPESESTQSRGHFFCSEAHRDAFFREQH